MHSSIQLHALRDAGPIPKIVGLIQIAAAAAINGDREEFDRVQQFVLPGQRDIFYSSIRACISTEFALGAIDQPDELNALSLVELFAWGVPERAASEEAQTIKAATDNWAERLKDPRRTALLRIAMRDLKTGTTRTKLRLKIAEANSMLTKPMAAAPVASLIEWAIKTHIAEVAARSKDATKNAA